MKNEANKVLVLKIQGRKFLTCTIAPEPGVTNANNEYTTNPTSVSLDKPTQSCNFKTFIINSIDNNISTNSTIQCNNCLLINEDNTINNVNVNILVTKVVSKRKQSFKKNRRKRYTRKVGYKEKYGYCKIIKVNYN